MKLLSVAVFIICCTAFNHAGVIKPNSVESGDPYEDQLRAASNNNNNLQKYSDDMEQRISDENDQATRDNLLETFRLFFQSIKNVKPDDHCSRDDYKNIMNGLVLLPIKYSAINLATVASVVGFATGGFDDAIEISKARYEEGDTLGAITGAPAGFAYGSLNQGINDYFTAFREPYKLIGYKQCSSDQKIDSYKNQIQTAFDNNDSDTAKKLLEQCACEMKQNQPNKEDKQNQERYMKTVNLLAQGIKSTKPNKKSSCDDLKVFCKALLLMAKLFTAFPLGNATIPLEGAFQALKESSRVARCRMNDGNYKDVPSGALAGAIYGANQGIGNRVLNKFLEAK